MGPAQATLSSQSLFTYIIRNLVSFAELCIESINGNAEKEENGAI